MPGPRRAVTLFTMCVVIGVASLGAAQERTPSPSTVALTKEGRVVLRRIQSVGIFLTGNDPVLARLAEDALAIQLTNVGLTVLNRAQLEKVANDHVARSKADKSDGSLGAIELVRVAKGHGVVAGTLLVTLGEQRSVLVRAASFDVLAVDTEVTVLRVLFDFEKGRSVADVAKAFAEVFHDGRR